MNAIARLTLASLAFIAVLCEQAFAQSLDGKNNPVWPGSLDPIVEPIRLRYADIGPVQVDATVLQLDSLGRQKGDSKRLFLTVSEGATRLRVAIANKGISLPLLDDDEIIADMAFEISPNRRDIGGLLEVAYPGFEKAGVAVTEAISRSILQLGERQKATLADLVEKSGDPVITNTMQQQAAIMHRVEDAAISGGVTAAGLSYVLERRVLVGNIDMTISGTVQGHRLTMITKGYAAYDLETSLPAGSHLRTQLFAEPATPIATILSIVFSRFPDWPARP